MRLFQIVKSLVPLDGPQIQDLPLEKLSNLIENLAIFEYSTNRLAQYQYEQRCKFGPKSLGESEAKRKNFSRGSAKRREAKKFLRSAKKSDKFSLLGEAKKANFFFLKNRMFFSNLAKKAKKKLLLGEEAIS